MLSMWWNGCWKINWPLLAMNKNSKEHDHYGGEEFLVLSSIFSHESVNIKRKMNIRSTSFSNLKPDQTDLFEYDRSITVRSVK